MRDELARERRRKLEAVTLLLILIPSSVAGCLGDGGEETPSDVVINLAQPFMTARSTDDGERYDAFLDIATITPGGSEVKWVHVSVRISSATGSTLLAPTPVSRDGGLYGSSVEVWFVDDVGDADGADEGDALKVTTMTNDYQGAQVVVLFRGGRAGSVSLPFDFP